MYDKNIEMAKRIAKAVAESGGRTYYTGGFVRDKLRHADNKDDDIEVHCISPPKSLRKYLTPWDNGS